MSHMNQSKVEARKISESVRELLARIYHLEHELAVWKSRAINVGWQAEEMT